MKTIKDLKLGILIQIIVIFLITSFFSIIAAYNRMPEKITYIPKPTPSVYIPPSTMSPASPIVSAPKDSNKHIQKFPQINIIQISISLFVVLLTILLFLEIFKGKFIFEAIFSIAMLFGLQGLAETSLSSLYKFLILLCFVILRFIYPRIWTHNFVIILGVAGISAVLGSAINFLVALAALILISACEIANARKIHYTNKFFKKVSEKGSVFALIIPENFHLWLGGFDVIDFKDKHKFAFFGIGHLVLILLLSVSVLSFGFKFSAAVIFGAIVGLIFNYVLFAIQKEKNIELTLSMMTFFALASCVAMFLVG